MRLSTIKKIARFQPLDEEELEEFMGDLCDERDGCVGCPIIDTYVKKEYCPAALRGDLITFYFRHGYFKKQGE